MIGQFMDNVEWGGQDDDLDYLVIDTPPGTSDEHITIVEHLLKQQQEASSSASSRRVFELKGAVLVTSPQAVSLQDGMHMGECKLITQLNQHFSSLLFLKLNPLVRKEINFCRKVGVKTLGLVENFSGYVCPHCQECTAIFSKGGGEALANEFGIPFLGCVLIDPALARLFEEDDDEGEVEGDEEEGTSSSTTSSTPSPHRKQPFNILSRFKQSALAPLFEDMVAKIIKNMT